MALTFLTSSLLSSYLYTAVLCVTTLGTGVFLVAWCHDGLLMTMDTVALVRSANLITGAVMILFVVSWAVFFICSSSLLGTRRAGTKCTRTMRKRLEEKRLRMTVTVVFGKISFLLLLISILTELTSLGFMWWTSFSLAAKFQIRDNCFCSVTGDVIDSEDAPSSVSFEAKGLNFSCPEEEALKCGATYLETDIQLGSVPITLRGCQRLYKQHQQAQYGLDKDCLRYSDFWFLFKILRIVLPLLAVFKLPFLILNCSKSELSQDESKCLGNFAADSKSWLGTEKILSPFKLVTSDHDKPSSVKLKSSPYFGTRLAPLGEETDSVITSSTLLSKANHKNNVVGLFASQNKLASTPLRPENGEDGEFEDVFDHDPESPVPSHQNTMSTPVQQGLRTPSFDLSRVTRPVYKNRSMMEIQPQPPPSSAPPASTFRSTFPAVLRDHLERVEIDPKITQSPTEKKEVFLFPAVYKHPLVPQERTRLGSLQEHGHDGIGQLHECLPRHNSVADFIDGIQSTEIGSSSAVMSSYKPRSKSVSHKAFSQF